LARPHDRHSDYPQCPMIVQLLVGCITFISGPAKPHLLRLLTTSLYEASEAGGQGETVFNEGCGLMHASIQVYSDYVCQYCFFA